MSSYKGSTGIPWLANCIEQELQYSKLLDLFRYFAYIIIQILPFWINALHILAYEANFETIENFVDALSLEDKQNPLIVRNLKYY